ncbi:hypothetical protein B4U84_21305 [Westiellopsis prolifica IICB1]|nr:hypothetical protein B4U84_21305 [Westiellopsis prolifica IICB1]
MVFLLFQGFTGQPGRFYTSAIATVNYIYKSWFGLMKRSQSQLEGKICWWEMVKNGCKIKLREGFNTPHS